MQRSATISARDDESSEQGEGTRVDDIEAQRARWADLARATLDGRRPVSISIPERDLAKLKTRAAAEGMPYQTLINSTFHKYVADQDCVLLFCGGGWFRTR
ncbi:MAG: hypothetical protein H7Y08_06160 [Rhizobiaceae bacterium]|nr:hypothetical protein [Rhizobiaceae bacterium]